MQAHIKWQKAPRDVDPGLSAGSALTISFGAGGDFRMLGGTVYQKNGRIFASAGDSESIWKGRWTLNGQSIQARFQLVYHDIGMKGEILPGPLQEVIFELKPRTQLLRASGSTGVRLDGIEFEINSMLEPSSVEEQIRFVDPVGQGKS